jgi:hypothetical protein
MATATAVIAHTELQTEHLFDMLNGTVTIAVSELAPNRVYYRVYRVL